MDAKLTIVDVTGSTNDDLLEAGKQGAPHGTGLAAQAQTAGRGRRGHKWDSTAGNLLLSIVLRPCVNPAKYSGLAAVSGLAVLEALEKQGLANEIGLKWPNDLVLEGRKLAGILTEASLSGRGVDHVVIGIGVNLRQRPDDFSPEVAQIATSLEAQGYPADRAALETALAEALCQAFGHLHTPEVYAADYRRLCLNLGQTLRIPDTGETVTALDIDRQYGLVVRRRDGTVDTLRCGEVSVRGLYGYV